MQEIIKQIYKINKILENRKNNSTLEKYNAGEKIHKKQLQFHKCNKRNRWVFGGNRTGKTECGAVECVYLARGIHPFRKNKKNVEGWVVSLSFQVQRDVSQSKIFHYLKPEWIEDVVMLEGRKSSPEYGIIDYILIKNVFGGISKIAFKSCDQGREKFQGTSLDFVWFDEEPPYDIYKECRMRVMDKMGDIFGTMTPLKGLTWVYENIFLNKNNDEEVWSIFMEWKDNPYLNPAEIKLLSSTFSQDDLESRRYGRFVGNGGLVYSEFDENIHVIDPFNVPPEWYDNISIDPGLHNPLSAHWYAQDYDGNVYVIAEHYEAQKPITFHAARIKEISARLNWHVGYNGMYQALIDSASNQRTLASEKSVTELFYDNGIIVNPKVNKDLFSGISKVKSMLRNANGDAKLFIFRTCSNLIREIKGYFWGNGDNPVKKDDHALDELRYYIMSKTAQNAPKKELNLVQKHKNSLSRQNKHQIRL